ncbi:MAG: hypothetical protein ACPGJE_07120, partial [Wenzhouxiangellaceae bacterium]
MNAFRHERMAGFSLQVPCGFSAALMLRKIFAPGGGSAGVADSTSLFLTNGGLVMSRLIAMVALVVGASLAWAGAQPLDKSVEIRGLDRPERVYGQYIVVMKPETRLAELDAHQMARSAGGALMHEYKTAL